MEKKFLKYAFHSWEFKDFKDASMSIATHWLHYWTWAFWGLRAFPNPENNDEIILFRLDNHAKRLSKSAKLLGFELSPTFIKEKIVEFVKLNKPTTPIYIRPFVYTSDLDISPRLHNIEMDFAIYGMEMWDYLSAEWISCTISSYLRQNDLSFPLRWKITWAYITSALAKTESFNRGYDEAILLNSQWKVSEGSAMNIFIVREGKIITPWVNQDILEWITRDSVMALAKHLWYEVIERQVDKSELFVADEVFMSWTAARVTPVYKIEQYLLPKDRPVFDALAKAFKELQLWNIKEFDSWVYKIPTK